MTSVLQPVSRSLKQGSKIHTQRSAAVHRTHTFVHIVYEPNPGPINATTLRPTKDALSDPAHPYHIRVSRRIANFDPGKLHWRTVASVDVCKKAMIRSTAARRIANAFTMELKQAGYDSNGQRSQADGQPPLKGALLIRLLAQPASLRASKNDLREISGWLLGTLLKEQARASTRR